jgi:hypothetical protein
LVGGGFSGGLEGDFSVLLWSKPKFCSFYLDLDQAEQYYFTIAVCRFFMKSTNYEVNLQLVLQQLTQNPAIL